jgi:charged multivesicular body protein 4
MSFFNFFIKKEQKPIPDTSLETLNILHDLRTHCELLEKRNLFITKKKDDLLLEIKLKLKNEDKKGALLLLSKKKKIESEIEKNEGTQLLLEEQISTIECSTINKDIVKILQQSNDILKKNNKQLTIENIDDLMSDIQEQQDNNKIIQDAMSSQLQQLYNDSELLKELEELENFEELDNINNVENLKLPSVPENNLINKNVNKNIKTDDDIELELKQLEKSMILG